MRSKANAHASMSLETSTAEAPPAPAPDGTPARNRLVVLEALSVALQEGEVIENALQLKPYCPPDAPLTDEELEAAWQEVNHAAPSP